MKIFIQRITELASLVENTYSSKLGKIEAKYKAAFKNKLSS